MMQILMHKVVQSLINHIEQTQGTDLFMPQQQSSPSYNFSTLRTTLSRTPKWDSADDIHTGSQCSTLDKTYALKQLLSTRGISTTSLFGIRYPDALLSLTRLSKNESQPSTLSPSYLKMTSSLPPEDQHHQKWDYHNQEHWFETG